MWYDQITPQDIVVLFAVCFGAALFALMAMSFFLGGKKQEIPQSTDREIAFLFRGDQLANCSAEARRLLRFAGDRGAELERVLRLLSPRFPDLASVLRNLGSQETSDLTSTDRLLRLRLKRGENDTLRLWLDDQFANPAGDMPRQAAGILIDELQAHRTLTDGVTFPMWRQTSDGQLLWTNAAYRELTQRSNKAGSETGADDRSIFATQFDAGGDVSRIQRVKFDPPDGGEPEWFELQMSLLGNDLLVAAVPIDRVVRAERSLSGFVQTLTQTFAHLNIGLAVFDRNRELAVFNPALTEIMNLPPEYLVTHPTLYQVFDRLREQRMVPETKDYKSWRQRMAAMEAAASDTDHSETWSLTDGRTFRVTGRPHPEGAVAFLFEDISEEIAIERRFRAELQIGQAVIDGLSEAIAVFTPSGALATSNPAYRALWFEGLEEDETPTSFIESSRLWQQGSTPTPIWGDARDFLASIGERSNWSSEVQLLNGTVLHCRFEALVGGHTLVGFSPIVPPVSMITSREHARLSA